MFILVDGHSVAYRTWFGSERKFTKGQGENLFAYMVLTHILAAAKAAEVHMCSQFDVKFVKHFICWDTPSSREPRRKIYAKYKDRPNKPQYLPDYLEEMRAIMQDVHPRYAIEHPQFEADDCIAIIATTLGEETPTCVITRDNDLYQLLVRDNIRIYDPFDKVVIDKDVVFEKYGFEPQWIALYKAAVGDSSDTWPGVHLFGIKKFQKEIAKFNRPLNARHHLEELFGDTIKTGFALCALPLTKGVSSDSFSAVLRQVLDGMNDERAPDWNQYIDRYNIRALDAREIGRCLT